MTETTQITARRVYTRIGALFVCSLFVGVYIGQTIVKWDPWKFVYVAFAETQGMVSMMVQIFAAFVLYLNAIRNLIEWRQHERTFNVRNLVIILFSLTLAGFFISQPGMEESAAASAVNSLLQGACTYGLFLARYGMMYYWVLRRFCEFRTIDRIAQLAIWFLWAWRDTPVLLALTPGFESIVDWLRFTLYTGALRGVLFTVACGALIIAIRALIGKEPGIIEMEVS